MKCPLKTMARISDCIKEECGWYDGDGEGCVIRQIGAGLDQLSSDIAELKKPKVRGE